MTRPLAADDFDTIRKRQREIAAEHNPAPAAEAAAAACQCPADHDAQGIYRKVHVPGCLAHFGSPAEIATYRHYVASGSPDPLAVGRPERGQ